VRITRIPSDPKTASKERADAREHHPGRHGADVHDGTTALSAHRRDHRLHGEERRVDVELGDGPQVVEPDVLERHVEALAGSVDQHVHASEAIHGRVHQRDDLRRVPQIRRHRERVWQLVRQVLDPVRSARGQYHLCPTSGRQSRGGYEAACPLPASEENRWVSEGVGSLVVALNPAVSFAARTGTNSWS
jgi:hypothetical protein